MKQIKQDKLCPCGSGLTYLECCADLKSNTWLEDDEGNIVRSVSMPPEVIELFKKYKKLLEDKLGRPLREEDKLFPDFDRNEFLNQSLRFIFSNFDISPSVYFVFIADGTLLIDSKIPYINTGDRIKILNLITKYATSNNRASLLKPFKNKLHKDIYEELKNRFEEDDIDEEDIMKEYMDLLVNDTVVKAMKKSWGIKEEDISPEEYGSLYGKILFILKEFCNDDHIINYLLQPFKKGKHFYIGGISELIDITLNMDKDEVKEKYLENRSIPCDSFTIHYCFDMNTETGNFDPESLIYFTISVNKISSKYALVMGLIEKEGKDIVLYPTFCIIPLSDNNICFEDTDPNIIENIIEDKIIDDMIKDGVDKEFVESLPDYGFKVATDGTIHFFVFPDDSTKEEDSIKEDDYDEMLDHFESSILDVLYRFTITKGKEVKITPNHTPQQEGYRSLPNLPKDYYLIELSDSNGYLGYTRKFNDL